MICLAKKLTFIKCFDTIISTKLTSVLKGQGMNINIPENYREEFDRAVDFALDKEYFTPKELAEYLEKSVLVASIMIGYMEKAGLITEGKNDEVRHTLITKGNWQSIGGKIENFTPPPKEEKKTFTPVILDKTAVDLSDIFEEAFIFGKTL